MLIKTGIPTQDLIDSVTPPKERRNKGAVAIVECFQNIPCNPCYTSCPSGAMKELIDINDKPQVFFDKCTGCGVCISHCPGLAIVVVDETYSDNMALIKLPYEFLPLPKEKDYVTATNRAGEPVCRAQVIKVINTPAQDHTPIVWLAIPKELSMEVRCFKLEDIYSDNTFLCRCEEVTLGEIRELIRQGYTTVDEIKRISRAGMGACQGRTCRQLIMNEISRMTGIKITDMPDVTYRPPVKPIKLGLLAQSEVDDE